MANPVVQTHWHLAEEYCQKRGLKWTDLVKYGVQVATVGQAFPCWANDNRPGLLFVHHDVRGRPLGPQSHTMRVFDRPAAQPGTFAYEVKKEKKPNKMLALKDAKIRLFIPKGVDFFNAPRGSELRIHESVMKAIVDCERGNYAVAFNGIQGSPDAREDLLTLPWIDREFVPVLIFDSNTNPGDHTYRELHGMAVAKIAGWFDINLGLHLMRRRLPPHPESTEQSPKSWGYDDWAAAGGVGLGELEEVDASGSAAAVEYLNSKIAYIMASASIVDREHFYVWTVGKARDNFKNVLYRDAEANRHPAYEAWLASPKRATFGQFDYRPGEGEADPNGRWFNTWRGWGVEPEEGDTSWWDELLGAMDGGAELENWLAWKIQNPMKKVSSKAMFLVGPFGCGKSAICELVKDIFGSHNYAAVTGDSLESSFTDYTEKCICVVDDLSKMDKRHVGKTNNLITAEHLTVNKKFQSPYLIINRTGWMYTSNNMDSLPMDEGNRRWYVIKMRDVGIDWSAWHKRRNPAALMFRLRARDVTGWDPYAPAPLTEGRIEMAEASRNALEEFVFRELPFVLEEYGRKCVTATEVIMCFNRSVGKDMLDMSAWSPKRASDILLAQHWGKVYGGGTIKVDGRPQRFWSRDRAFLTLSPAEVSHHVRSNALFGPNKMG